MAKYCGGGQHHAARVGHFIGATGLFRSCGAKADEVLRRFDQRGFLRQLVPQKASHRWARNRQRPVPDAHMLQPRDVADERLDLLRGGGRRRRGRSSGGRRARENEAQNHGHATSCTRIGSWRAYAREAQQPDAAPSTAASAAAPAAKPTSPASAPQVRRDGQADACRAWRPQAAMKGRLMTPSITPPAFPPSRLRLLALLTSAAVLGACASFSPDGGFSTVEKAAWVSAWPRSPSC